MTQEQRWLARYESAITFIRREGRNPSKFDGEEREIRNWIKHQRKLLNAGALKPDRVARFRELLALSERYRRKNQWE